MTPLIAVIVSCRVKDNPNSDLKELFRSIAENSRNPKDVFVGVKFDNDDELAYALIQELRVKTFPFQWNFVFGEQRRGYIDIHYGYNQLLECIPNSVKVVIAMADDFRAERDWDSALMYCDASSLSEFYIIHQRKHPVLDLHTLEASEVFNMEVSPFEKGADLYIIDEAPAWSRALLNAVHSFPVSFTDAWTLCLEYVLWNHYNVCITHFLPTLFVSRKTCSIDQPGHPRWETERKDNFEYISSNKFRAIVQRQATAVFAKMEAAKI